MRLSPTAKDQYLRCPLAYYMKYVLGYREEVVGSALPFGSANDSALDLLLHGKTLDEAKKHFKKELLNPVINNKRVDALTTKSIKWSKSDSKNSPTDEDHPAKILLAKGNMILDQYAEQVLPKIKNVLGTQIKASLKNNLGDEIYGYADMIVEWEDGRILLLDNKTSSKKYDQNMIDDKVAQIALYEEALRDEYDIDASGFVVMVKDIRKKKEPRVVIQDDLILDISEEVLDNTFNEFEEAFHGIKMGLFHSNHPNCNSYFGNCICSIHGDHGYNSSGGQDTSGLVKVERRNKKWVKLNQK